MAIAYPHGVLDRSRRTQLAWSLLCLGLFAALAAIVAAEPAWLVDIDSEARPASRWALRQDWLDVPLHVVERGFGIIAVAVYSLALALAMFVKGHRRAALLIVAAMAVTMIGTWGLKELVGRERPEWQHGDRFLREAAFPSGHASHTAALAALGILLAVMLVRRGGIRRLIATVAVVVTIVVAADRVLLGRHFVSDTIGGALLGTGVVLLGLALYSPLPRSHAAKAAPLPHAFPPGGKLAVVLNPIKVESVEQFQSIVTQMATESGWSEPRWYFTTVEDPGTGQAEQAAVDGAELVIVCGGDGTVREVCAELAGTGIPVGIVPAGTGNLLARNLAIPLFIRAAIDIALTGQDRAIDMVSVRGDGLEDTHFMVMAGMGFDAAIMEGVNEDIKKRVGWLAYVWSGLKSLMFPSTKVEISIDGGEWTKHRARTIVVGNVGYLQAGMPLLPDAAIDDGKLDVVLLNPQKFLSWIPLAIRILTKQPRIDETMNRMTGRTVSVRASSPTPRQLDGDTIGLGHELHMECIHGRLLVRVPR